MASVATAPVPRAARAGVARERPSSSARAILARESRFRRLLAAGDAVAVSVALYASYSLIGGNTLKLTALAVPLLLVVGCKAVGLYDRDENLLHKATIDELPQLLAVASLSALLLFFADGLFAESEIARSQVVVAWLLLIVLLPSLRSISRAYARRVTAAERCLFVGDAATAEDFRGKLGASRSINAELVGWLPDDGELDGDAGPAPLVERIQALIAEREVHRIVFGPRAARSLELLDAVRKVKGQAVKVSVVPDVARVVHPAVELDRLYGMTLLGISRFEISQSSRVIKRAFDLAGSSLALLVLSPVLIACAIAIKLDSRGPVFFRQRRAGRHGEPFEVIKLRTMVDGADEIKDDIRHLNEHDGLFKIAADPRITRVGRFLRRRHLDELPQLLNVLRGDMSLVGPRPLVLEEDRRIEGWHRRRLDLRPGMTGPWQALGGSKIPLKEMVALDYRYVADWSLWNDVKILLLTAGVVVRSEGL